ncbi:MAG: aldehyde dehydrogenase family protein [Actinomycetota bacterium]|nr:aldehyde dehydrogenase family protein [Actinomycetota bacterium]
MAEDGFKVTYATISADNEEMAKRYEEGIEKAKSWMGKDYPFYVNGQERNGAERAEERSPIDNDIIIGHFAQATRQDARDAVAAAKDSYPNWSQKPWRERVEILRHAADLISERVFELGALTALEVGKNQLEALGEVEEAADLIRYYCHQMEEHDGFSVPMGQLSEEEKTRSVLRPYGVWAVISPFNFPIALSAGPVGGALAAGNTVVLKPSEQGFLIALKLYEILHEAGVPAGVVHVLTGPGETVGQELHENPDVAGLTFTGSYDVGMKIYKNIAKDWPKPVIVEMGGKNPAIVSAKADIDKATDGVLRSAFGYSGQKCSACSRVLVQRSVYDDFVKQLVAKTAETNVGNPLEAGVYVGPVIDGAAVERFESASAQARQEGRVLAGGARVQDDELSRGNFVEPTVVEVPIDSRVWRDELFVPLVAVHPVDSLEQALELANDTPYGLTAGFYSEDRAEVDTFLNNIEAGVVYVNRRAGATTGAWPGIQPFGGWKGSGNSGKAGGGLYYVQLYMREQSQTIVED